MNIKDLFDLKGKVAVVTGGGRGIGKFMAVGLAEAGANVVIASRKLENLEKEVQELEKLGVKALAVKCDLAKKEDIEVGRQLAKALGGEVACSRPIAEELQWLPEDLYLGISGKKVKPALYIGLGVSGQVQHITGIRDSKVIFAVNRDENAPIFEAADYGIVGDLYTVVPMLIEELKSAIKA